jgi:nucleoside-diphosphate-sugar epimerase
MLSSIHAFVGITNSPMSSSSHLVFPRTNAVSLTMSAVSKGDTVVVVGGSGGVGQLVSRKLAQAGYPVRVTSRNPATDENDHQISMTKLDLVKGSDQELQQAILGAAGIVISVGTTAFPTLKWKGGNTPQAIDDLAVTRLAQAASQSTTLKRIVLVTSIGVDRTDQMPFLILNLFGVLDAKKRGEEAVRNAALKGTSFDYAIIRPGRLIGGPFTNLDLAKLLQLEGGAENGVTVAAGDVLLGDCKRDACAEAIVQCLTNVACSNVEFSIVSNENETAWSVEQWASAFQRM